MRKLEGIPGKFMYAYIVGIGLFHLYTSIFGSFEAYLQRNIHLGLVLPLAFFLYPMTKNSPRDRVPIYDWVLGVLAMLPGLYVVLDYDAITSRVIQVDCIDPLQNCTWYCAEEGRG